MTISRMAKRTEILGPFRVTPDERREIDEARGEESMTAWVRQALLEKARTGGEKRSAEIPGQRTVEEVSAEAGEEQKIAADVERVGGGAAPDRDAWVNQRVNQLFGRGMTSRVARAQAEAEWRAKHG